MKGLDNIDWKKLNPKTLLQKEIVRLFAVGILCTILGCMVMYLISDSSENSARKEVRGRAKKEPNINAVTDVLKIEDMAHYLIEDKVDTGLEKSAKAIEAAKLEIKDVDSEAKKAINGVEGELGEMKKKLEMLEIDNQKKKEQIDWLAANAQEIGNSLSNNVPKRDSSISVASAKSFKKARFIVPTGTMASALVVEGADVSTSTKSGKDPKPFQVVLTSDGLLPGGVTVGLKGCVLKGDVRGELDSERGEIRLTSMTCTDKKTHKVFETQIVAHVIGSDGKAGSRGRVVSKREKMLFNIGAAGAISGFSKAGSKSGSATSMWPFGSPSKDSGFNGRLKEGGLAGIDSASEKLSDIMIDEYNRTQPILELGPAKEVEVTFDRTAYAGDTNIKNKVAKKREANIAEMEGEEER